MTMNNLEPKRRAFTLIELIMAIVVTGIVAIPLALLVAQHVLGTSQSIDLTVGRSLARLEMEKVNNMAYANITNATTSNYAGYGYDVTRTVTFTQGNASSAESLKKIIASVTKSGNSTAFFNLTTYIAKNVTIGL